MKHILGIYIDGFRCACVHHIINAYIDLAFWPFVEMCYVAAISKVRAAFILSGMRVQ